MSEKQLLFQYDKQYTTLAKHEHTAMAQHCRHSKYHTPAQAYPVIRK